MADKDHELKRVDTWTYEVDGKNMFLPFFGRIPDSFRLQPGDEVTLKGRPLPDSDGFSINLTMPPVGENYNCALHFNPRLKEKRVVRDHRPNGHWTNKETYGGFPFQADRDFKIVIAVHGQGYKIFVDGTHFCDFTHKVHPSEVTHVCLRGHLSVSLLRVHFDSSSRPHKSEKAKNSEQFDSSELKWTSLSGQTVTQAQDSVYRKYAT